MRNGGGGANTATSSDYYQDEGLVFKVIPDSTWGRSGNTNRAQGNNSFREVSYYSTNNQKFNVEDNEDNEASELEDIIEEDLENDEPQVVFGYAAKYVD
jgi:hypothetical protein